MLIPQSYDSRETDNKKDNMVVTTLGLANLKILNNYNTKLMEEIDDLLKNELKQVGFTRKGGKNERNYSGILF